MDKDYNVQVDAIRTPHGSFLKELWFKITHCAGLSAVFGHTSLDTRVEAIKAAVRQQVMPAPLEHINFTGARHIAKGQPSEDYYYHDTLTITNPQFNPVDFSRTIIQQIQHETREFDPTIGSTLCMTLITRNPQTDAIEFTVTNLGDSGLVLLVEKEDGSLLIVRLVEYDKPNLPRIQQHIEANGGILIKDSNAYRVEQRVKDQDILLSLAMGAVLADHGMICLVRYPKIVEFKPGTAAYQELQRILDIEKSGDIQELMASGRVRFAAHSDYPDILNAVRTDWVATFQGADYKLIRPADHPVDGQDNRPVLHYFDNNKNFFFGNKKVNYANNPRAKARIHPGNEKSDDMTLIRSDPRYVQAGEVQIVCVLDGHGSPTVALIGSQMVEKAVKAAVSS